MTEFAIKTDGLSKQYGKSYVVNGVNLRVQRGAIYGFLGRNGAGKTTTIKMLLGLARVTTGSAHVLGLRTGAEQIAIFQRTAFVSERKMLPNWTANKLVGFTRKLYPGWSDTAVEQYAKALEIPMTKPFEKLSQGNRTKVCLLLALAQQAELLILDEPTTGLDPLAVDQLLRILVDDAAARGTTIFFSSHQLSEVEQIADWVGVIDNGKLLLESTLDDIKSGFRLITAVGNVAPPERLQGVVSAVREGNFSRYVVAKDADILATELTRAGATVTEISPLGLKEIFIELVRKEQSCISGNSGKTPVAASSSI